MIASNDSFEKWIQLETNAYSAGNIVYDVKHAYFLPTRHSKRKIIEKENLFHRYQYWRLCEK